MFVFIGVYLVVPSFTEFFIDDWDGVLIVPSF